MMAYIINDTDHMQNATQQISFTQLNYWFSLLKTSIRKFPERQTNLNTPSEKKRD